MMILSYYSPSFDCDLYLVGSWLWSALLSPDCISPLPHQYHLHLVLSAGLDILCEEERRPGSGLHLPAGDLTVGQVPVGNPVGLGADGGSPAYHQGVQLLDHLHCLDHGGPVHVSDQWGDVDRRHHHQGGEGLLHAGHGVDPEPDPVGEEGSGDLLCPVVHSAPTRYLMSHSPLSSLTSLLPSTNEYCWYKMLITLQRSRRPESVTGP